MLTIDFETTSEVDLLKSNPWTYSEHPSTEVICLAWKSDDQPTEACIFFPHGSFGSMKHFRTVSRGDKPPVAIQQAISGGQLFEAFNVAFEYSIWHNIMVKRFGWPEINPRRWRDPQATAAYLALPLSLDALANVLGKGSKDPEGKRLITKYSKRHLKTAKAYIPPEDVIAFTRYCIKDVEVEYAVSEWLGELPEDEQEVWYLDLLTNLRGLPLDVVGIHDALAIVEGRSEELSDAFCEITGLRPGQHVKVKQWLYDHGLETEDLQADTVATLLAGDDLEPRVREALELRSHFNKASTKKLAAMLRNASGDGRMRFQTRYHGTSTGRNTGAGAQPLNFTRNDERIPPEMLVRDIGYRNAKYLDAVYGDAMDAVSKSMRHWIAAEEGKRFIVGDFSSIEAVVLAMLAGEDWKIELFRNNEPIYERAADIIYKLPPGTVNKKTHPDERQDGKRCELAFGYQGSVGAWRKFDKTDKFTDDEIREINQTWRAGHPATCDLWADLDWAMKHVCESGEETQIGDYILLGKDENFLYMEAPDNKRIWYAEPWLQLAMPGWHNEAEDPFCAAGVCDCTPIMQLHYKTWKDGSWIVTRTYGGKTTENACQFIARQILAPAYRRVADAGYDVILTVYDELAAEMEYGAGSASELQDIMEVRPEWAHDWPIRADCWEGERYKK